MMHHRTSLTMVCLLALAMVGQTTAPTTRPLAWSGGAGPIERNSRDIASNKAGFLRGQPISKDALSAAQKADADILEYLTTHPNLPDRVKTAAMQGAPCPGMPEDLLLCMGTYDQILSEEETVKKARFVFWGLANSYWYITLIEGVVTKQGEDGHEFYYERPFTETTPIPKQLPVPLVESTSSGDKRSAKAEIQSASAPQKESREWALKLQKMPKEFNWDKGDTNAKYVAREKWMDKAINLQDEDTFRFTITKIGSRDVFTAGEQGPRKVPTAEGRMDPVVLMGYQYTANITAVFYDGAIESSEKWKVGDSLQAKGKYKISILTPSNELHLYVAQGTASDKPKTIPSIPKGK